MAEALSVIVAIDNLIQMAFKVYQRLSLDANKASVEGIEKIKQEVGMMHYMLEQAHNHLKSAEDKSLEGKIYTEVRTGQEDKLEKLQGQVAVLMQDTKCILQELESLINCGTIDETSDAMRICRRLKSLCVQWKRGIHLDRNQSVCCVLRKEDDSDRFSESARRSKHDRVAVLLIRWESIDSKISAETFHHMCSILSAATGVISAVHVQSYDSRRDDGSRLHHSPIPPILSSPSPPIFVTATIIHGLATLSYYWTRQTDRYREIFLTGGVAVAIGVGTIVGEDIQGILLSIIPITLIGALLLCTVCNFARNCCRCGCSAFEDVEQRTEKSLVMSDL